MVELIVMIMILGVLAATALPRLIDFQQNARVGVVRQTAGEMASAAQLGAMKCQVTPGCYSDGWAYVDVQDPTGSAGAMYNGYPTANTQSWTSPITHWLTIAGFDIDTSSLEHIDFKLQGAPDPSNCAVRYNYAHKQGDAPEIVTTTSGC